MQMTPASDLKPLQVRLPGPVLEEFKTYAQEQGQSMASLMLGWIEAALAGNPPAPASPAGAPATEVPSSGDVLAELKTQTALLQALVSQAAATPHGGTEPRRVVITEPAVARPDFKAKAGAAPSPAPPSPAPLKAAYGLGAMATELPPAPPELAPCVTKQLWREDGWESFRPSISCVLTLADGAQHKCAATGRAGDWFQIQFGNYAWLAAPAMAVILEE